MPKDPRTSTKEFKLEAVQLVKSSHKPLAQMARDLGSADSTLHHWRKLFTEQGEQAFPGRDIRPYKKRRSGGSSGRWNPCVRSVTS